MKILVCISIVPDTTSKITKEDSNNFLNKNDLTYIVGPYDDYALSRAIEIKESNANVEVAVFHVGLESSEPLIRKCLALGADYAFRINGDPKSSIQIANEICHYSKENNFDLILMGKEAIDYNSGMIHGLVAAGLNYNHFSPVMKLEVINEGLELQIETDLGKSTLQCKLPAVLGCQEPIAEWKIPSMRGIMTARTKEIKVYEMKSKESNFEINYESVTETNRKQIQIPKDNLDLLIQALKKDIQFN
jgi:electron transfer flavoprotein beta subunit